MVVALSEIANLHAAHICSPAQYAPPLEQLVLKIDAGASGLVQVAFSVESQSPQVIVRALPDSVTALDESAEDFATFDEATGQLLIPGLEIGGQIVYRNLVFLLTDAVNLLFSLQSLEEG